MRTKVKRVCEEIFPPWPYWKLAARLGHMGTDRESPTDKKRLNQTIATYVVLPPATLEELGKAEVLRGQALDEKTYKFGATFATLLTFASGILGALSQVLPNAQWRIAVAVLSVLAILYSAMGGLLGLAAARTMRTFGTGPLGSASVASAGYLHQPILLAEALAFQERMNLQRVARNECAFMCIRNGAIFIVLALVATVLGAAFGSAKEGGPDAKVWPAVVASNISGYSDF